LGGDAPFRQFPVFLVFRPPARGGIRGRIGPEADLRLAGRVGSDFLQDDLDSGGPEFIIRWLF
jgi:hypothetical protein